MPRAAKEAGAEPKKRSRTGCWPCKARKVKCGEEKPVCANCSKNGETCDYSIRLNWGGRSRKDKDGTPSDAGSFTFVGSPGSTTSVKSGVGPVEHVFSAQHIVSVPSRPPSSHPTDLPTPEQTPGSEGSTLDPRMRLMQQQLHLPDSQTVPFQQHAYHPTLGGNHAAPISELTPPTSAPIYDDFAWSPESRNKRMKLTGTPTQPSVALFAMPSYPAGGEPSPSSNQHATPHSITSIVNTPATPGSSVNSGSPHAVQSTSLNIYDPPDLRRLSVKSLLADTSEDRERNAFTKPEGTRYRTYGYDHGFPDIDIPHNDDNNVILPRSPDMRRASAAVSEYSTNSTDVDAKMIAFEPGGYYAQPVPIRISNLLLPLPPELLDNQMNLLYFHHFINHTGRIMVPHDCPENPFRGVLPQMAVRNPHLLHLLLAFSASHRAKLLDHPEPENRIAEWMADVLPALRMALNGPASPITTDPADPSSLAPLATAIMLASLEIVSPSTFSVRIPWQQHLLVARQMILDKGGLHHLAQKADGARDKAIFFLSRWFAYLDVLGSLSNRFQQPLFGAYMEDGGGLWLVNRDNEEIYQIDCFFGFSGRCIALLAQVAELAAQCDNARIDPVTNQVKFGWQPSATLRSRAEELRKRLEASATMVFRGCMHSDGSSPPAVEGKEDNDMEGIYSTNEAYHWAGIIHLLRRALSRRSSDPDVQEMVERVISSLRKVRRGSSAESCLLFPMFVAGCEARLESQRAVFTDRLKAVEGWGMQHVGRANEIMQTVWSTGRPWEEFVDGEFFG